MFNARAKPPLAPGSRFSSLQVVRAFAAIAVAVFHAGFIAGQHAAFDATRLRVFQAGVEVFFVLSGFVIYSAHAKEIGRFDRLGSYARKRLVRIYPIYWLVFVVLVAGQLTTHTYDGSLNAVGGLLQNITLVPLGGIYTLTAAWTLGHEMLFYLVFSLAFFAPRALMPLLIAWAASILVMAAVPIQAPFPLSRFNLLFLLGIGVAYAFRKFGPHGYGLIFIATGVLGLVGVALLDGETSSKFREAFAFQYGLAAALLIYGAAVHEAFTKRHATGVLPFLGDASYSIYLIHAPAMAFAALLLGKAGFVLPGRILFVSLLGSGVVAGAACRVLIEAPLLRKLNRIKAPTPVNRQPTY